MAPRLARISQVTARLRAIVDGYVAHALSDLHPQSRQEAWCGQRQGPMCFTTTLCRFRRKQKTVCVRRLTGHVEPSTDLSDPGLRRSVSRAHFVLGPDLRSLSAAKSGVQSAISISAQLMGTIYVLELANFKRLLVHKATNMSDTPRQGTSRLQRVAKVQA